MNGVSPLVCYKRFLDDNFMVWLGSQSELHSFHRNINTINPSIKFTMEHTKEQNNLDRYPCHTQVSIPFLHISICVRTGGISSDLNRKKTDRC